jgi:hypothetical protein
LVVAEVEQVPLELMLRPLVEVDLVEMGQQQVLMDLQQLLVVEVEVVNITETVVLLLPEEQAVVVLVELVIQILHQKME